MTRASWTFIASTTALLAAAGCAPNGPDAASSADEIGIELVAGGDASHGGHADDHDTEPDDGAVESATGDHDRDGDGDGDAPSEVTDDTHREADEEAELGMPAHDDADVDEMVVDDHAADETTHDPTGDEARDDRTDDEAHDETETADAVDGIVVEVEMVEFGFVADTDELPSGEPVTFRFSNTGVVPHEAMFGSHHQQEEFAESTDHDSHGGAGHHGEVAAITLEPGSTSDITLEFAEPGEVWIGCHLPGHYDAGMAATFIVT